MAKKSKFEEVVVAIFRFILQNFGDLTTLILAGYIFISSNLSQLPTEALLTNIIGLLGLMAISDLVFREIRLNKLEKMSKQMSDALGTRLDKLEKMSEKVENTLTGLIKEVLLYYRPASITEDIKKADTIWMIGNTLESSLYNFSDYLVQKVRKHLNLKIIMMDFRHTEAIRALCNMYLEKKEERTKDKLIETINNINDLSKYLRPNTANSMELGIFPSLLRYGMIIIDPDEPDGRIYLKLYRHTKNTDISFRPMVLIEKSKHPDWFTLFYYQAQEIWRICKEKGQTIKVNEFDQLRKILETETE